jgi:hypothetical protein
MTDYVDFSQTPIIPSVPGGLSTKATAILLNFEILDSILFSFPTPPLPPSSSVVSELRPQVHAPERAP